MDDTPVSLIHICSTCGGKELQAANGLEWREKQGAFSGAKVVLDLLRRQKLPLGRFFITILDPDLY
jgi:hypothetical protein